MRTLKPLPTPAACHYLLQQQTDCLCAHLVHKHNLEALVAHHQLDIALVVQEESVCLQMRVPQKQLQHCTAQLQLCEMVQLLSCNGLQVSKRSRCADATGR